VGIHGDNTLVAIFVLRWFFRTDLRSMIQWLDEFRELRAALEPKKVPHAVPTLSYAERRLSRSRIHSAFKTPLQAGPSRGATRLYEREVRALLAALFASTWRSMRC